MLKAAQYDITEEMLNQAKNYKGIPSVQELKKQSLQSDLEEKKALIREKQIAESAFLSSKKKLVMELQKEKNKCQNLKDEKRRIKEMRELKEKSIEQREIEIEKLN